MFGGIEPDGSVLIQHFGTTSSKVEVVNRVWFAESATGAESKSNGRLVVDGGLNMYGPLRNSDLLAEDQRCPTVRACLASSQIDMN
jgi:hypothetical protein